MVFDKIFRAGCWGSLLLLKFFEVGSAIKESVREWCLIEVWIRLEGRVVVVDAGL